MKLLSEYIVPCICGHEVHTHTPETTCPHCGRLLVVEPIQADGSEAASKRSGGSGV